VTPGPPPPGEPVPADGALPPGAADGLGQRPFGIYVHVPFCRTRCGYCDFNTYTATELGPGVSRQDYAAQAIGEIRLARRVLGRPAAVSTVFFGGGTPTLLPPADLAAILAASSASSPGLRSPRRPTRRRSISTRWRSCGRPA
jgi:coproporphyrinogen III oxidase-like Fe-S oxidoreductase